MKFIYIYIWNFLALLAFQLDSKFFWPITKFIKYDILKSKKDMSENFKKLDEAKFAFPFGVIDWHANAVVCGLILVPLALFPAIIGYKFSNDRNYIIYYLILAILVLIFVYYNNYFKNKKWIKKEINKRSKKYSMYKFYKEKK